MIGARFSPRPLVWAFRRSAVRHPLSEPWRETFAPPARNDVDSSSDRFYRLLAAIEHLAARTVVRCQPVVDRIGYLIIAMQRSMCHPSGVFLRRITRKRSGRGNPAGSPPGGFRVPPGGLPAKTGWTGAGCGQGPDGPGGGNAQGPDGSHVGNAQGPRDLRTVELRSACKVTALGWRRRDRPGTNDEEGGRHGPVAHAAAHS